MGNRRAMRIGDWFNGAAIMAAGVLLGVAADGMVKLAGTAFWPLIFIIPGLFAGLFATVVCFDWFIDRLVPGGVKPASRYQAKAGRPLALLLSLPAGVIIGMIGAQLGLRELLI